MIARTLLLSSATLLIATGAHASFSYTGTRLVENFDGIQTTTFSATNGVQSQVAGTTFDATRIDGVGTTATPAMPFITDNGSSSTGGIHNYGATGATDRALGTLASGSNTPAFGVLITNNSGSILSAITLAFRTEEYRNSTVTQNVITFAYGLSGGTATASNYLTAASLTNDARFNLVGDAPVDSNGQLATPLATAVAGTINVTVAIGQSIFLRWSDVNDAGNDAGLAIDDFSFTATPLAGGGGTGTGTGPAAVPEPASFALLGLGLAGLAFARRRGPR